MSSKELSFEEKKTVVQDKLISVITNTVDSPVVRFWKPEERTMTEEEMGRKFEIYNGFIYITHYSKKSRKTVYKPHLGRWFGEQYLSIELDPKTAHGLYTFTRNAGILLDKYFSNHYSGIYIGRLRFDFLTADKKSFVIPNFMLETNLFLYRNIVDANSSHNIEEPLFDLKRLPIEEFVEDEWEDIVLEKEFGAALDAAKNSN